MSKSLHWTRGLATAGFVGAMATAGAQPPALNVVIGAPVTDPITYRVVATDLRRCAPPHCGGHFVQAVNQALTRCADGKLAKRCHVARLDTDVLGWSAPQRQEFESRWGRGEALVQGRLSLETREGEEASRAAVLTVGQAWQGEMRVAPQGTFYGVQRTGVVCITVPCPSLKVQVLNGREAPSHPALDLTTSGASERQIAATGPVLTNPGIIVAGRIVSVSHPDLRGRPRQDRTLVAHEFYLPAPP